MILRTSRGEEKEANLVSQTIYDRTTHFMHIRNLFIRLSVKLEPSKKNRFQYIRSLGLSELRGYSLLLPRRPGVG